MIYLNQLEYPDMKYNHNMDEGGAPEGKDNVKAYLRSNPELAEQYEKEIMSNAFKLMSPQSKAAAVAAGRAVDVSADDFEG